MTDALTICAVGILICVIGILNMTGNISSLHRYHRHRVSEENKKPFGKLIGLGTVISGGAVLIYGALSLAAYFAENAIFSTAGMIAMAVMLVVGLGICFYAMIKYNKGIF